MNLNSLRYTGTVLWCSWTVLGCPGVSCGNQMHPLFYYMSGHMIPKDDGGREEAVLIDTLLDAGICCSHLGSPP